MIYVCIPARDEESTIGVLLWKIRKVMAEFGREYRILVLDDGSRDRTPAVLDRYRNHLPLQVIRNERPVGYGAGVEALLREASEQAPYPKRDVAVTIQGDFTEGPEVLVEMVKAIEGGADIVSGTAVEEPGRSWPGRVRITRWAAAKVLARGKPGATVSDPISGLRAYRVVILRKAFRGLESPLVRRDGWAANVELLARLALHARRIEEVPAPVRYERRRRASRVRPVRILRELWKVRREVFSPGEEVA